MAVDVKQLQQRFAGLKEERNTWENLWRDIRDYEVPDLGAFQGERSWEGGKRYGRLYDAEAADSADILAAGLLAGVSSPSRPWLRLTTMDAELDESPDVKEYLSDLQDLLLMYFAKSEVYNALHRSYLELPVFGTACSIVQKHPERMIDMINLTCGEYWLAADPYDRIDTVYRTLSMTAKQMVQKFGVDAVSSDVLGCLRDNPYKRFDVVHAIEPRLERDIMKHDNKNMPWRSVYWEQGRSDGMVLGESGFNQFPALCPRWLTSTGTVYGRGPGAKALSASKSLQRLQKRLGILTDYLSDPPIQYPAKYKGMTQLFRPGGRIPVDPQDNDTLRTAWAVQTDPQMLQAQIADARSQIQRYFNVNIFQMIAANQGSDRTATEIQALEQEKVMMLGPVLERLHTELLDPLVTNAFTFLVEADKIPEPPEAMRGRELNVEYISVLAQMQKSSAVDGIIRTVQQIGVLSQLKPEAIDKLDADKTIDLLADMNGVPPSMIVAGSRVALVREKRAQEQAQMQEQAAAAQAASSLKDLGAAADSQGLGVAMSTAQEQQPEANAVM